MTHKYSDSQTSLKPHVQHAVVYCEKKTSDSVPVVEELAAVTGGRVVEGSPAGAGEVIVVGLAVVREVVAGFLVVVKPQSVWKRKGKQMVTDLNANFNINKHSILPGSHVY